MFYLESIQFVYRKEKSIIFYAAIVFIFIISHKAFLVTNFTCDGNK